MSEIVKNWLKDLYENEIKVAKSTISNEKIWLNGADVERDVEAISNHNQNIENNEEYIEVLENKIEELEEE